MSKLVFVTGNANKLREVKEILLKSAPGLFDITSRDLDLPEIQGTTQEVAKAKVEAAAIAIGGPCITEVSCAGGEARRELILLSKDTALGFEALGGLPGPYIKYFMLNVGHDGSFLALEQLAGAHRLEDA